LASFLKNRSIAMALSSTLRFAARQLRKNPGFTATVLVTLGLCIGANTAIFTVVDTLFFRPLPYPQPGRLFMIGTRHQKGDASETQLGQDGQQWESIRDHASFIDSAVYAGTSGVNLFTGGHVEYVQQQRVSANFFRVLGISPLIGREFTRQEDVDGGPALAILSYGLWERVFRRDPSVIGKTMDLKGAPYAVVGVMPRGFRTEMPVDVWTPVRASQHGEGSGTNFEIIARLKPGVSIAAANGQLTSVTAEALKRFEPSTGVVLREAVVPLQSGWTQEVHKQVYLLWGAVGLVLLIGCVNIAGLLLARSAIRSREIATRMAVGASRTRVIAQLLAEAVLLAVGGGLLGMLIGQLALPGLINLNPGEFSMWGSLKLDWRVLAIMMLLSLGTSIVFGLLPAFEATSIDIRGALAEGGRGTAGVRRVWKRQALVFVEVTLGVVLVAGAGLLVRTFAKLANLNPGFNPNHVLTASLSLQDARYATTAAGARLFRESLDRIREIPGVASAAVALSVPYERPLNDGVQVAGGTKEYQITNLTWVTPQFFETLEIPRLRGRLVLDSDKANTEPVTVINQAFVTRYLNGRSDPLGAELLCEGKGWRVVGVVADVEHSTGGWGGPNPLDLMPHMYIPVEQAPDGLFAGVMVWFSPSWIVKTHGSVPGIQQEMRRAVEAVDPRLPFSSFHTMDEVKSATLAGQRYRATLFSTLAGLALLLSALGIYGLVAQSVTQRTREMGIRLALGATVRGVILSAAAPGVILSLSGIFAGLALALFAGRLLQSLIWGVTATDPATFLTVTAVLIVIAFTASVVPALRITRLDPAVTLRDE